jgi:outer membrane protein OmpA-like peptidoglycan-associated protein
MKSQHILRAAMLVAAPLLLQACATKGFVREQVATARLQTDSALATERDARIAGDNDNAARIAALRTDLDSMRTQFGAKIAVLEDGIRFAVPVTFAYDDANVSTTDQPILERFARVAQRYYPDSKITVEGFADPAGSDSYNLALSRRRAENVGQTLATLGVPRAQLRTVGYGETRLITPGATKDEPGAQRNRRVVFVIETGAAEASTIAMATP